MCFLFLLKHTHKEIISQWLRRESIGFIKRFFFAIYFCIRTFNGVAITFHILATLEITNILAHPERTNCVQLTDQVVDIHGSFFIGRDLAFRDILQIPEPGSFSNLREWVQQASKFMGLESMHIQREIMSTHSQL